MVVSLSDPLLGRVVDGRYEVRSRIARGGMATVYLAVDRRLDREVALKVMHPHLAEGDTGADFVARFRREARAAARLAHPGLVAVLDQGVDEDTSYLAMEYVEGTNLRRVLNEEGPLPVGDALRTVEAVLEALAVAHRAGLVHRDVKPENVLVTNTGQIKLGDFGLARAVSEATGTTTGTVLGTVAYLAPELVTQGVSDTRTDVYAVGILLFELLTGTQPFLGETPIQVAYQHVHGEVPPPSEQLPWLPVAVDDLVLALTARSPSRRPEDAAAAVALVQRVRSGLGQSVLARRAGSTARPAHRDLATDQELLAGLAVGGRLPIGSAEPPVDPDATTNLQLAGDLDDGRPGLRTQALSLDSDEAEGTETRRRNVLIAMLAGLVLLFGLGGWWFMAAGPGAYTRVPTGVVGAEFDRAEAVLADAGLQVHAVEVFDPQVPIGHVVSASPDQGESIRKGGTVELAVSKGPDLREVPEGLSGMSLPEARAALEAAGFLVPTPEREYHDTVPADHVISATGPEDVTIEDGMQFPVDSRIDLVVSDGPAPVTIPSVVGMSEEDATSHLDSLGLKVEVKEGFSDEYAAGLVSAQTPAGNTPGHRTDTVTLTISKGPELVEVPDVVEQRVDEAQRIIEEAGLEVEVSGPLNREVRAQYPQGGEKVERGTVVRLFTW